MNDLLKYVDTQESPSSTSHVIVHSCPSEVEIIQDKSNRPTAANSVSSVSSSSVSEMAETMPNPNSSTLNETSSLLVAPSTDKSPILNLNEILQLFSCAISQEQGWAVLYQVLSKLKHLLDFNLDIIRGNQDRVDINSLNFAKDGTVFFDFEDEISSADAANSNDSDKEQEEKALVESKVLKSVAYLIYDALDYGNNYMNEPDLQTSLTNLLLQISGHYKEYNSTKTVSEDDEGYEQEDESIGIEKAIEICNGNIPEADYHCKAVCRGLYAQAYELKVFLAKIEDSKNVLHKSGKDPAHYCFEVLDKTDWAKLWMQVIHELRHGVKLRKVSTVVEPSEIMIGSGSLTSPIKSSVGIPRRNIEYELTPFEILLDQIRARRYHLKKVSLNHSIGAAIKKDARDIILDFIRSRPPLKKTSQRKNRQSTSILSKSQPVNLHEQLMISIRNYSTPLRRVEVMSKSTMSAISSDTNSSEVKKKKLIKVDKKLLNHSSDDDESEIDEDEIKNLPILQDLNEDATIPMGSADLSSIYYSAQGNITIDMQPGNQSMTSFNGNNLSSISANSSSSFWNYHPSLHLQRQQRKRIKAPESLKSPLTPWRDQPEPSWKAFITDDLLEIPESPSKAPPRRHTMTFADLNRISSTLSSLNIFSSASKKQQHPAANDPPKVSHENGEKLKNTKNCGGNKTECLKLTFDELCHIRNVLTKAELDYLLFDNQLFNEVSRGKCCFSCRKTKFNLFTWGQKCRICQQKVCKKCLRSVQLKNGCLSAHVPLFKLQPAPPMNSPDKYRSMRVEQADSSRGDDDFEILSISSATSTNSAPNYDMASSSTSSMARFSFEICVDCFQMMEGVVVSASEVELGVHYQRSSPCHSPSLKKTVMMDSADECLSSPASLKSNEDIVTMMSIHNLRVLDSAAGESTAKSLNFARSIKHHQKQQSTPNQQNHPNQLNADLSTIGTERGEGISPSSSSSSSTSSYVDLTAEGGGKLSREGLSLNLQPVYDNSSSLLIVNTDDSNLPP